MSAIHFRASALGRFLKQTSPDSSPDGISVHKIPGWIERYQETKKLRTTELEQSERENGKKNKTTPERPTPPIEIRREEKGETELRLIHRLTSIQKKLDLSLNLENCKLRTTDENNQKERTARRTKSPKKANPSYRNKEGVKGRN